jgi:hypothetical protein
MPDPTPEIDKLKRLRDDCNAHKGRMRKLIADGKLDAARELSDTLLPIVVEAIEHTMAFRDGVFEGFGEFAGGMQDHEDRLDALEVEDTTTILMPEDAETFAKVVGALRTLCEELLASGAQPAEGEARLKELLALCTTADAIIEQSAVPDEDEDEEEGDEAGTSDDATAPGGDA